MFSHQFTSPRNSVVFAALLATLVLVLGLIITAEELTQTTLAKAAQVVEQQHQKLHNLMNLQIAGQKRTVDLQLILLQNDAFDQDQSLMSFYRDSLNFGTHRDNLAALIGKNQSELAWLKELDQGVQIIGPLQNQIAQLAMSDSRQQAKELFLTKGMSQLEQFNQRINNFSLYQAKEIQKSIGLAKSQVDKLMQTFILLATVLIGLSIFFSLFVTRHFKNLNQQLQRTNENLEQEVQTRTQELTKAKEDLQKQNQRLQELSSTDPLTQLSNRLKIEQTLELLHQRFYKKNEPYCVLLMDLDHFKSINDTFGHRSGDMILQEFASMLKHHFKTPENLGRWGGEEFIAVLVDCDLSSGLEKAEDFKQILSKHTFPDVGTLTFSGGLACPHPQESISELLHRADTALYQSKHAGRNRTSAAPN